MADTTPDSIKNKKNRLTKRIAELRKKRGKGFQNAIGGKDKDSISLTKQINMLGKQLSNLKLLKPKLIVSSKKKFKNKKVEDKGNKLKKKQDKKKVAINSTDGFPKPNKKKVAINSTDGFPKPNKKKVAINSTDGFPKPKNKKVGKTKRPISIKIQGGDSLSKIASKYGTTVKELMNSNKKITNPNMIKKGDSLTLGKLTPKRKSVYDNLDMKPKVKSKVVPSKSVTNTRKDNREEFGKAIKNMPTPVRKDNREEFGKAIKNMPTPVSKDKSSSLSSSLNNPIAKGIIKSKGGESAFRDKKNLSSMIGRAIGSKTTPEESMNTAVYNELANEYNNDSGQMSEAKKDLYLKMKNSKSGGKVGKKKGGMVKRSYGGKVKRNMGGMVSPRKKVVFRRGGGRALRGMGKAIYSNKMY
jgi:hypothetical protein